MTPPRRLPTGVFVLVATVLLGAGAAWWNDSAPDEPAPPAPSDNLVILQFNSGAMLTYDMGNAPSDNTVQQFDGLQALIDTQWPCRVEQRGLRSRDLRRGGYNDLQINGVGVIQLPRCAASLNSGP